MVRCSDAGGVCVCVCLATYNSSFSFFTRDEPKEPACQSGLCSGSTRWKRDKSQRNVVMSALPVFAFSILYFSGKATAPLLILWLLALMPSFFFIFPPSPSPFVPLQSEIGFGKLDSYTKLDKLGEVRNNVNLQLSFDYARKSNTFTTYVLNESPGHYTHTQHLKSFITSIANCFIEIQQHFSSCL